MARKSSQARPRPDTFGGLVLAARIGVGIGLLRGQAPASRAGRVPGRNSGPRDTWRGNPPRPSAFRGARRTGTRSVHPVFAIEPAELVAGAVGENENSSTSDEENHGACSPRDACDTLERVRLKTSSILPGDRIALSNSATNIGLSPSLTTVLGAAAYITAVFVGAMTGASPAGTLRKRRSNGFLRDASRMAIFTRAPLEFISARIESRLNPSRRTSASVQICALTGMM